MSELEFQFIPHGCLACVFSSRPAWGEVLLISSSRVVLHRLIFPVMKGNTVCGSRLFSLMEELRAMYMSTTRGLPA